MTEAKRYSSKENFRPVDVRKDISDYVTDLAKKRDQRKRNLVAELIVAGLKAKGIKVPETLEA